MGNDHLYEVLNAALEHHRQNRLQEAGRLYQEILSENPNHPEALLYKGVIALQFDQLDDAHDMISRALVHQPENINALINMATVQSRLGNSKAAIEYYEKSLALNPEMPEIHYNLGIVHQDNNRPGKAAKCYERAIALRGDYTEAHYNLGVVLHNMHQNTAAAECYEHLLEMAPDDLPTITNLGCVRHDQGRFDEALTLQLRALQKDPEYLEARANMGRTLYALGRYEEAEQTFRDALRLEPGHAPSNTNLSALLLLMERFDEGWKTYSWRWGTGTLANRQMALPDVPEWSGEDIANKQLLISGEQGIGEQIMFSTMIAEVLSMGAVVTFECDERLLPLYSRSFPEVTVRSFDQQADALDTSTATFDYKVMLGSLPLYLHQSGAPGRHPEPLLTADPNRIEFFKQQYAALGDGPLIGISWRSNSPTHQDRKNISLDQWAGIFQAVPGGRFVSLQYGATDDELNDIHASMNTKIHLDGNVDALASLDDLAAQISAMDVVVTISNATAHLAGGLGVPSAVMVEDTPLWHWFLERGDSPWYDSIRLFRQSDDKDWHPVILAVGEHLKSVLNA